MLPGLGPSTGVNRPDARVGNGLPGRIDGRMSEVGAQILATEPPPTGRRAVQRVLIVDDSRVQRRILSSLLARSGYEVIEAASAEEGISRHAACDPDLVISDWMMPGMTGIEFCQRLRIRSGERYVYFILLTSKTETAEIARGLDGGADDFLTKPVSGDELRARIAAGERILRMEREVREKNRLLTATLGKLQSLYDSLDRDLMEARKLQQSLVRDRHRDFGAAEVSLLLRPSGHVGGDLVGFFPIAADRVGLYSIDVSGHGIAAALLAARLAGYLTGARPEQNLALLPVGPKEYAGRDPAELAGILNRIMLSEMQTDTYFTLAYADVDLRSGRASLVQAGHPNPVIQRADGRTELIGSGGMPIGLIDGASYQSFEAVLAPGDRLFLMSDGITEAEDEAGSQLGDEGLQRLLHQCAGVRGTGFLEALIWRLGEFTGGDFADDVSGVTLDVHAAQ